MSRIIRLSLSNFVSSYIVDPFSIKLNSVDKVTAFLGSILLGILTLGTLQLYTCLRQRHIAQLQIKCHQHKQNHFSQLQATAAKVNFCYQVSHEFNTGQLTRENIGGMVQQHLIQPCYAQKKPSREHVEVPVPESWTGPNKWQKTRKALWKSLTTAQKIEVINHYALAHNKISAFRPGFLVDLIFLWSGHSGVELDPRTSHGSDHAIRASLWAAVFAYFYGKYHPEYTISQQDVLIAQFAAAGHDCARQTESVDLFDEWSAETTVSCLSNKIGADLRSQQAAFDAIAHKDATPSQHKPLIAKCVQNADCAEFSRLLLRAPMQADTSFRDSRTYLDLWKEMNTYALGKKRLGQEINEVQLKGDLTFGDFLFELDAVRTEMNHFIYMTRSQEEREIFSRAPRYYDAVRSKIKFDQFPLLHTILTSMGA